jgi:hypothetical protein
MIEHAPAQLIFDVDTWQRPLYGVVRVVSLGYRLD